MSGNTVKVIVGVLVGLFVGLAAGIALGLHMVYTQEPTGTVENLWDRLHREQLERDAAPNPFRAFV